MADTDTPETEESTDESPDKKGKKSKKEKKKKKRGFPTIRITLLSIGLMVWLKITFIFILIALLPSFVAYFVDMISRRKLFMTIFGCNMAAMLPYLFELIAQGNSPAMLMNMMYKLDMWVIIYGAAFCGWIISYFVPIAAKTFIALANQSYVTRLNKQQEKLVDEWGPEVRRKKAKK